MSVLAKVGKERAGSDEESGSEGDPFGLRPSAQSKKDLEDGNAKAEAELNLALQSPEGTLSVPVKRNTEFYVERDSRGRERLVVNQSSSQNRKSTLDLLNESHEREQVLIAQITSLETRLSFAERNEFQYQNLRREHQNLVNEHSECRNPHTQLEAQVRTVSPLEAHSAALQHEIAVQKIALSSLQNEHDKLLAAFSRSQTRSSALEKKCFVSDEETITLGEEKLRLQAHVIDLERDVKELSRSRDQFRRAAESQAQVDIGHDVCPLRGCEGAPRKFKYCENRMFPRLRLLPPFPKLTQSIDLCQTDNCKYPKYSLKSSGDSSSTIESIYCPIREYHLTSTHQYHK
jgi:hypothetical protein